MPRDSIYGNEYNEYKYILSGYKVTRPMSTKQVKDIADMIADFYKIDSLTYPKVFYCDNGSEFKAGVTKLLEKHGVMIRHAMNSPE